MCFSDPFNVFMLKNVILELSIKGVKTKKKKTFESYLPKYLGGLEEIGRPEKQSSLLLHFLSPIKYWTSPA